MTCFLRFTILFFFSWQRDHLVFCTIYRRRWMWVVTKIKLNWPQWRGIVLTKPIEVHFIVKQVCLCEAPHRSMCWCVRHPSLDPIKNFICIQLQSQSPFECVMGIIHMREASFKWTGIYHALCIESSPIYTLFVFIQINYEILPLKLIILLEIITYSVFLCARNRTLTIRFCERSKLIEAI